MMREECDSRIKYYQMPIAELSFTSSIAGYPLMMPRTAALMHVPPNSLPISAKPLKTLAGVKTSCVNMACLPGKDWR